MKKTLISLLCLCFTAFEAQALKIYLLSNHDNAGDHNQTLGIHAAFNKLSQEESSVEDIDTKIIKPSAIKAKVDEDLHEKVIVIGAGEGGIDGIAELTQHPNLVTCLTSHMCLDRYKDPTLLRKVDFIALPTHVASDVKQELGAKLIETTGVAHNRQLDMATYEKWKTELPPAKAYLGVYLGGDAPTPTKEMKLFTKDDAARLADYVVAKVQEMNPQNLKEVGILVLNGPRTGKFDAEKKEDPTVHRAGKADPITDFFGQKLAESGVNYKIFDFQHTPENKPPYNAVDLAAGAVNVTGGTMVIPGESTSVISEFIDTLPKGKVIVYHNSAMNEVHQAHVESELNAGRVYVLKEYKDIEAPVAREGKAIPGASQVIAQVLFQAVTKAGHR